MKIVTRPIDKALVKAGKLVAGPLLRASLDGGCDLAGCQCAPDPFITVSDGKTLFHVTLTKAEARTVKAGIAGGLAVEVAP